MDRVLIMRVTQQAIPNFPPALTIMAMFYSGLQMSEDTTTLSAEYFEYMPLLVALGAWLNHFIYFVYISTRLCEVLEIHPFKVKNWEKLLKKD